MVAGSRSISDVGKALDVGLVTRQFASAHLLNHVMELKQFNGAEVFGVLVVAPTITKLDTTSSLVHVQLSEDEPVGTCNYPCIK